MYSACKPASGDIWVHRKTDRPYYVQAVASRIKLWRWWFRIPIVIYVMLADPEHPDGPFCRLESQFRRSFYKVE